MADGLKEVTAKQYAVLFARYRDQCVLFEQVFFIGGHPQCPEGYQRIIWARATDRKVLLRVEQDGEEIRFWAQWWIHAKQKY